MSKQCGGSKRRGIIAACLAVLILCSVIHSSNTSFAPLLSFSSSSEAKILLASNATEETKQDVIQNRTDLSCERTCRSRPNKIILDHLGAAGLSDRLSIFKTMTSLAGYLCAAVYAPLPITMIYQVHNRKQTLSNRLHWSDFSTFHFVDSSSNTSDSTSSSPLALKQYNPYIIPDIGPAKHRFSLTKVPPAVFNINQNDSNWIQLELLHREDVVSQIERLERIVESQQQQQQVEDDSLPAPGFIWMVYESTFSWRYNETDWLSDEHHAGRPSLRSSQQEGCDYSQEIPSRLSLELVDRVMERIETTVPTTTTLGHFHIRRGDSIKECDTSFPALYDYLSCSFHNTNRSSDEMVHHFGNRITLMIASNEWSACYRSAICQIIEQGFGFGCVDLDQTIESVLHDYIAEQEGGSSSIPADRLNNNMFVYHLSTLIQSDQRIKITLSRRRQLDCRDCVDVVGEFGAGGHAIIRQDDHPQVVARKDGWELSDTIEEYESCIIQKKEKKKKKKKGNH